ncbi:hypothetical protein [Streptomyces sp. L2]|uniref:hypothetical protein n=1 Tax=Streptomyces sp. L2 TaxID=2162665 RepID=UPI001011093D|nr:hypothetical protein [Streptomyces sp. L2]
MLIPELSPHSVFLATNLAGGFAGYSPWLGAVPPLGALAYGVHRTFRARERTRLEGVETALTKLLEDDLDAVVGRALVAEDLAMLRRRHATFERFARLNKKVRQLGALVEDFRSIAAIPPAADPGDEPRHQQELGEALGRLRSGAESAYAEVHRRRNR